MARQHRASINGKHASVHHLATALACVGLVRSTGHNESCPGCGLSHQRTHTFAACAARVLMQRWLQEVEWDEFRRERIAKREGQK